MKKIVGLILIAVAVCAIASLVARSRRQDESEEQAVEATETPADEKVLVSEEVEAAEAVSEPA